MISSNDTSIVAMLTRFPDMSPEEADRHIDKIENQENVPICMAIIGRIRPEELSDDARLTFEEIKNWSNDRTQRTRMEQITARQKQKETKMARKMIEMHNKGQISDQTLVLFGISGPLPERSNYERLSIEQRNEIWEEKMRAFYGRSWRRNVGSSMRNFSFIDKAIDSNIKNWQSEGF